MIRLPDDRFLAVVDRCIAFEPSGNDEEDIRALTQQIMDALARWVAQYPDQWYMFRRMWPTPASSPNTAAA
jgi:lauroyl/myristoyl acyltransferase